MQTSRRREWMDVVNRGALEDYVDLMTEDVVWLPPAGEPILGREAFRAWLEPFLARYAYGFSVEPVQRRSWEGWCAELGRFRARLSEGPRDKGREHGGPYFVLWRREGDGAWRIERYVDGLAGET